MRDTTQPSAAVVSATEPDIGRLAREVAELRAENAANRVELEAVRAQVMVQNASPVVDDALACRDQSSRRRLRRRRGGGASGEPPGLVSRRRLFGLLGGAAAAGAGLAVAGSGLSADPAGAADGDPVVIGSTTNSGTGSTQLTSSTTTAAFKATSSGAGGAGLVGVSNNGANAWGVEGFSSSGYGLVSTGNGLAQLLLIPATGTGAPTTGAHLRGEFFVDSAGTLFQCVTAGTPGTWVRQSPLVSITPSRAYDSRPGLPPLTGPKTPIAGGTTRTVDVTTNTPVPEGASAVLGNITVTNTTGGGFLTVYPTGVTQPGTSNINWLGGWTIANNFTSGLGGTFIEQVDVTCGGTATDFIIDIFGYYP
jgi:hypothetical protein